MNKISVKKVDRMVQQQSVHLRWRYYTGRFLNVNTFYKNNPD